MAAAEASVAAGAPSASLRRLWLGATIALTLFPFGVAVLFAPAGDSAPSAALVWLLFVGSSAHVGATAWFYFVPEVRVHMRRHTTRYVWLPVALMAVSAAAAIALSTRTMTWVLLAFFAWQFFHFQKQNLGVAALAASSVNAGRLSRLERHALTATGVGGIGALLGHPQLLQLHQDRPLTVLFGAGACVFVVGVLAGLVALTRRTRAERPTPFTCVYLISLLFFLPVFFFASPYAAVSGLTMAHGLQYLLLVGLLARAPTRRQPAGLGIVIFVNIALVIGLALNQAAHLHSGGTVARAIFGVYLGAVMAHFVIDAGLWRLRDEFPRRFLTERLPFLLTPDTRAAAV
ncbi:MAG: hypothetical protein QOF87_329 [Pseudonocardiales bacterium]|nr:hypothetical protein [Pseudonocardiales bacterium]